MGHATGFDGDVDHIAWDYGPVSMRNWHEVLQSGMSAPDQLGDATADLVRMLADPDPRVREHLALVVLMGWIDRGHYDDLLTGLGDGLIAGLEVGLGEQDTPTVFRRSASAAVLTEVLLRDANVRVLSDDSTLRWGDRLCHWFIAEKDDRGWVADQGWANAVSHGADALAALARSRHLGRPELSIVLDFIGERLLTPTERPWHHGEDDRLASAVMVIVHREKLGLGDVEPWLSRLGAAIRLPRTRGHLAEWPTPTAHNIAGFLRALHLQLALGVRGRDDVESDRAFFAAPPAQRADLILAILEQIRAQHPWLYQ